MIARATLFALAAIALCVAIAPASAAAEECALIPRTACFGIETASSSLISTQEGVPPTQAGSHPDLSLRVGIARDPLSTPNVFGLKDSYAATRDIRIDTPPGLIGDPNVLGVPQQCTAQELITFNEEGGGCPNGSQIGVTVITAYDLTQKFKEPIYMMTPPGGDVVARLGTIAGLFPTFIDLRVRSEDQNDFGLSAEVTEAPAKARLIELDSTLWGAPAASVHDEERCTPIEAFTGCVFSPSRPPGGRELPFLTNPTRCGVPLAMDVNASSWVEPALVPTRQISASFPEITGCNLLPFGPALSVEPTSHHTASPSGINVTIRLPGAEGVKVLEPSQTRDIRIDLPRGISINPGSADGLGVCSAGQVRFGENVNAECPSASKLASLELEVDGLQRRLKGAIYLREPEPGNLFRGWIVADDLGAHVKLPGQLNVDKATGQITAVQLNNPQVPLREARLEFKSGFRAPLLTPASCGNFLTHYDFSPWSGGPDAIGDVPISISEGCDTGGFAPQLSAGSTDPTGGAHSPFVFKLTRGDSEENVLGLDVTLPRGLSASLAGISRCEGADAATGNCPANSKIGSVTAADRSRSQPTLGAPARQASHCRLPRRPLQGRSAVRRRRRSRPGRPLRSRR